MSHVYDHIIQLGYIRRESSKENKMLHKKFKVLYDTKIKHIVTLSFAAAHFRHSQFEAPDEHCDENTVEVISTVPLVPLYSTNFVLAVLEIRPWILCSPSMSLLAKSDHGQTLRSHLQWCPSVAHIENGEASHMRS